MQTDKRVSLALVGCLIVVLSGESIKAGQESKLQLFVTADKDTVPMEGWLTLDFRLKNRSEEPITVFGKLMWGPRAGVVLEFIDVRTGKPADTGKFDDNVLPPSIQTDPDAFVTLQPGHYLGRSRRIVVSDFIPAPGDYDLRVSYRGPIRQNDDEHAIRWESAEPASVIRIHVVRPTDSH